MMIYLLSWVYENIWLTRGCTLALKLGLLLGFTMVIILKMFQQLGHSPQNYDEICQPPAINPLEILL